MGTGLAWGGGFLRRGSIGDRGIGERGERRRNISILSPIGTAPFSVVAWPRAMMPARGRRDILYL